MTEKVPESPHRCRKEDIEQEVGEAVEKFLEGVKGKWEVRPCSSCGKKQKGSVPQVPKGLAA